MNKKIIVSNKRIIEKIYLIRDQKIMLDRDLASLYGVETKRLKEAVRRNLNRFPKSFMFEMTQVEFQNWRTQFATSKQDKKGLRYVPFCFTEHGILMLSSILNSEVAIKISIHIIETFVQLSKITNNYEEIRSKLKQMESQYREKFEEIYLIIQQLLEKPKIKSRQKIGYKK